MRRYRHSMRRRRRSIWRRLRLGQRRRRSRGGPMRRYRRWMRRRRRSMRRRRRSMRRRHRSMQRRRRAVTSAIARSYWRYRCGVYGDIGDCGVGITPQMCYRVTNHGDMSTFSKPASALDVETYAFGAATSAIARGYRRYQRVVSGDIGDCGGSTVGSWYNSADV